MSPQTPIPTQLWTSPLPNLFPTFPHLLKPFHRAFWNSQSDMSKIPRWFTLSLMSSGSAPQLPSQVTVIFSHILPWPEHGGVASVLAPRAHFPPPPFLLHSSIQLWSPDASVHPLYLLVEVIYSRESLTSSLEDFSLYHCHSPQHYCYYNFWWF